MFEAHYLENDWRDTNSVTAEHYKKWPLGHQNGHVTSDVILSGHGGGSIWMQLFQECQRQQWTDSVFFEYYLV